VDKLVWHTITLLLLRNTRKTERGAKQLLTGLVVRAAPFALLRNSRKTECGAKQFLSRLAVRAAPFALMTVLLGAADIKVDHVTVAGTDLEQMQARLAAIGMASE
jgi:hypothetical protein